MYLDFFNLSAEPFSVTPDPDFLYLTPGYREALATVIYGVEQRKGFVLLVGEVGTGKTTILRASLAALLRRNVKPVYIFNAAISFDELLRTILREPDDSNEPIDKLLNKLHRRLVFEYKNGNNFALIVDEAQNMSIETLEQLRMLSNMETNKNKLLQIVLAGQPELDSRLDQHELRQLRQRIAVRATTGNLDRAQSLDYIRHRLSKVEQDNIDSVFEKGALKAIVKAAQGNPRILNMLCDNALISSYGVQQRPVSTGIAKEIVAEVTGPGLSKRSERPLLRYALIGLAFIAGILVATSLRQWWVDGNRLLGPGEELRPDLVLTPSEPAINAGSDMPSVADTVSDIMAKPAATNASSAAAVAESDTAKPDSMLISNATAIVGPMAHSITGNSEAFTRDNAPEPPASDTDSATTAAISDEQSLSATLDAIGPDREQANAETVASEEPLMSATDASITSGDTATDTVTPEDNFPRARTVQSGDSISSLITDVYGYYDNQFLELIRRQNPQIKDLDVIDVGDQVIFPAPESTVNTAAQR